MASRAPAPRRCRRTGRAWVWFSLPAAFVLAAGCATYGENLSPVLDHLARGDVTAALAQLEKSQKDEDALWHLEHGALLRLSRRWAESREAFDRAEALSEELYTRSLSREAAALATTDRLQPYRPPYHERLLARFYATLDEIDSGDLEGAAVEARRMEQVIQQERDREEAGSSAVEPLATLLAGVVFEAAGELNPALVSYRRHLLFSKDSGPDALRAQVRTRARRLSASLGIPLHPLEVGDPPDAQDSTLAWGSPLPPLVLVVVEQGLVRSRTETRIDVPILEGEEDRDRDDLAPRLRSRCLEIREGAWEASHAEVGIAYWLALALPAYPVPIPLPEPPVVRALGEPLPLVTMLDVEEEARRRLEAEYGGIVLRSVLRALIKWSVQRGVEKKTGELGGLLANLVGATTEAAETRTWLSLPRVVRVAWVEAPSLEGLEPMELAGFEGVSIRWPGQRPVGFAMHREFP